MLNEMRSNDKHVDVRIYLLCVWWMAFYSPWQSTIQKELIYLDLIERVGMLRIVERVDILRLVERVGIPRLVEGADIPRLVERVDIFRLVEK